MIQGRENTGDGNWYFDDGTMMTYTDWASGQPNDNSDNCIAVRHTSYEWKDINCYYNAAQVCQIPI